MAASCQVPGGSESVGGRTWLVGFKHGNLVCMCLWVSTIRGVEQAIGQDDPGQDDYLCHDEHDIGARGWGTVPGAGERQPMPTVFGHVIGAVTDARRPDIAGSLPQPSEKD